jgi:hypothetical protein
VLDLADWAWAVKIGRLGQKLVGANSHVVNRKRMPRLMRSMGLAGMAPGPNPGKANTSFLITGAGIKYYSLCENS